MRISNGKNELREVINGAITLLAMASRADENLPEEAKVSLVQWLFNVHGINTDYPMFGKDAQRIINQATI